MKWTQVNLLDGPNQWLGVVVTTSSRTFRSENERGITMAQQRVRTTSRSDVAALRDSAREDFAEVLTKLDATLKAAPRIFPSGIELIKLTLKAGSNIEFSVVIAGKDAPKVGELTPISAESLPSER